MKYFIWILTFSLLVLHLTAQKFELNNVVIKNCLEGKISLIKDLMAKHGVSDVTAATDDAGETCLHYAAEENQAALLHLLLCRGADVNAGDKRGTTPLHWAAMMNSVDAIERLVAQRGVDIDVRNSQRETPLRRAINYNQTKAVAALVAAGANLVTAKDSVVRQETFNIIMTKKWMMEAIQRGKEDFDECAIRPFANCSLQWNGTICQKGEGRNGSSRNWDPSFNFLALLSLKFLLQFVVY